MPTFGHNFDFDSYLIVAEIMDKGQNVYAETTRYNYAPFWFHLLHSLYQIAGKEPVLFRYLLVATLTLVDVLIFTIIYKKVGQAAALIFFLNPISIIISGYHNQFENIAILFSMLAVLIVGDNFQKSPDRQKLLGAIFLGFSLLVKHIFFLFPLWMAVKEKRWLSKVMWITIPILIFLLSFLPYWADGQVGIMQNVFNYRSLNNEFFYWLFVPPAMQLLFSSTAVWFALLFGSALIFRKKSGFDSLLYYTCILVMASPSVANQYLVIVLPFAAVNFNPFTLTYMLLGTIHLFIDGSGLNLLQNDTRYGVLFYPVLVVLLLLGLIRGVWPEAYFRPFQWLRHEIANQFKPKNE